jgi:hypothetical protein
MHMDLQEVKLYIPKYVILPDEAKSFTEEENLLMLLIGINAVLIVKKEYIDNDLCKEIEQKIKKTYQNIIDDRERQNKELNDINSTLKKTFEETSMKTIGSYYEKLQDGISKETKNISLLYETQLENQRTELYKYQEKIDRLNRELTDEKLSTERKIGEEIRVNRKQFENEIALQLENKENEIRQYQGNIHNLNTELMQMKIDMAKQLEKEIVVRLENKEIIIEKQTEDLRQYQERVNDLEKMIIKLEDSRIYNEKDYNIKLELETSKIIAQKETELITILDRYKATIDELKEKNVNQELSHNMIDNNKNCELMNKCKLLDQELLKTRTEYNEYKVLIEKEKNLTLTTVLQRNELLLQESKNTIDDLKKEKNMTNTLRGDIGENYLFELLTNTFSDFENFNIEDKSKVSHSADLLVEFKNFSILVDSKNYSTLVKKAEIKKLCYDINSNKHIKIAWLVSLHTPITGFSQYPVMYEIKDNVCYCYINSLSKNENPQHFLRTIWYACNFIFDKILNVDTGEILLGKYKKNEIRINNIVDKMLKKSKERYATLKQLTENFDETDRDLKEILSDEIISVYEMHSDLVKKWWNNNIKFQDNGKLKSKSIYDVFISDENNKNSGISIDSFKHIVKDIVGAANIVMTGKTNKADYTILQVGF